MLGARVVGYWLRTDVDATIRRNARRTGRPQIPVVGILATANRMQPPTIREGYEALFVVSLTPSDFSVATWPATTDDVSDLS